MTPRTGNSTEPSQFREPMEKEDMTDKQSALVRAGIRPVDWGKRKGTQTHTNRRRADRMGVTKHRNRDYRDYRD